VCCSTGEGTNHVAFLSLFSKMFLFLLTGSLVFRTVGGFYYSVYPCPSEMLVFVLATFCWTKSLLYNVAAFTGMMLYPESTLQLCSSRRFCEVFKDLFRFPVNRRDDVVFCPDSHQSATSVRTTRSFRPDTHQCLEASNSSRFHPSRRNGKSSGRFSEFEKTLVFQSIRPDDVAIPSERHSVFDKH
jgi:hypothetical protein